MESTVTDDKVGDSSYETAAGRSSIPRLSTESMSSNFQATNLPSPDRPPKRTRSAGRGTFVVKEELRRSTRSLSEPRTPNVELMTAATDKTLIISADVMLPSKLISPIPSASSKNEGSVMKSPMTVKTPSVHL